MSDLFHPEVPDGFIFAIFKRMEYCKQHTFLILTKRPRRMQDWLWEHWFKGTFGESLQKLVLPNVWLGVSVENQEAANERIPILMNTPAAKHFISCEPLLSGVDLLNVKYHTDSAYNLNVLGMRYTTIPIENNQDGTPMVFGMAGMAKIDWVICGGESGPNARPLKPEWAKRLLYQCEKAGTPFFFKQWGEFTTSDDGKALRVGKQVAGRMLNGKEYSQFPE
jgi:protein gp37